MKLRDCLVERRWHMLYIKTPELYISEADAITSLGKHMKKETKRALLVWSATAKKVTQETIIESLGTQGIMYLEYIFTGYPTLETALDIAKEARKNEVDTLIAVGGGRVIDATKAAGDLVKLSVVAVPTIAATCAAWAALSVMYTKEGNFDHFRQNEHSPQIVIADTNILAKAPSRYIKAGVVDTLAKWYETRVGFDPKTSDFSHINSVQGAKLGYDYLSKHAVNVIADAEKGIVNEDTKKTVDAILFLAGNVGSYIGEKAYSGFAHPFYHASRILKETRKTLHGEIVAFGLIMQAVLEKKSEEEIKAIIRSFSELDVAFTLDEIGIEKDQKDSLQIIQTRMDEVFPNLLLFKENTTKNAIVKAALQADEYVKRVRKEQLYAKHQGKKGA